MACVGGRMLNGFAYLPEILCVGMHYIINVNAGIDSKINDSLDFGKCHCKSM